MVGVPNNLPKPTTEPVFQGGEIDPGAVGPTFKVVVEPNPVLLPDDRLTVHWEGRPGASTSITNQPFPSSGNLEVTLASDPYIAGNSNGYVEVWYEATRNSQPVGSSQRLQLHVGAAAERPWPLPKLVDASGSQVNPWSPVRPGTQFDSNTATIVVTDNRIVSGDTVGVVWALPDGTRPVVPWQNAGASGEARLPVPPQVMAQSLGQTVTLAYAVFRGPQQTVVGTSTADLQIGQLPASALSELFIVEAANGGAGPEFDVSGLTGNATVRVGRWPLIAAGQTAWLTLAGTKQDGTAYSKSLMTGGATDADWVSQGFKTFSILNDELKGLKNESPLTVTLKVSLGMGSTENLATMFTVRTYTIKAITFVRPTIAFVVDSTGNIASGGTTYDSEVTVAGAANPNQEIQLMSGGDILGRVDANISGTWTVRVSNLAVRTHRLVARELNGSGLSSIERVLIRAAGLSIDTSVMVLDGTHAHLEYHPSWVATGSYAANVAVTRRATGGSGAISYRSSNTSIATVDGSGRVISQRNGTSTITASDSAGHEVSYSVRCTNNFLLVYTSELFDYQQNLNWLRQDSRNHPVDNLTVTGAAVLHAIGVQFRDQASPGVQKHHTGTRYPSQASTNLIVRDANIGLALLGPVGLGTQAHGLCFRAR
ncbi:hypothetical protein AC788_20885 [Pseudomonas sp. RIT-PI-a]|nr:hypothetical protein AC788_20885 [Pseudomonas sp. RIT-PI-a]